MVHESGSFVIVYGKDIVYKVRFYMNIGNGYQMECGERFSYSMIERLATTKEIGLGVRCDKGDVQ